MFVNRRHNLERVWEFCFQQQKRFKTPASGGTTTIFAP